MIGKREGFTLSKRYAVFSCLLMLAGLMLITLFSANGASADVNVRVGTTNSTTIIADVADVTATPTGTATSNTPDPPCTVCDVLFWHPEHGQDVSLSYNPDGTLHWAANLINKPSHDNSASCTLAVSYRVSVQVHCHGGSGGCGGGRGEGWTVVQMQHGPAMLSPRMRVTLAGDLCYHWPSGADKLRIEFALDTNKHECNRTKKSQDIPVSTLNPTCQTRFPDVPANHPFYTVISGLSTIGAISGYEDGTFKPDKPTYRGQLAKIVVLAFGVPVQASMGGPAQAGKDGRSAGAPTQTNSDGHFSDVPEDHPYYPYIEAAFFGGLIDGYEDGTFRPYNNVTRGQVAKIVVQAAGLRLVHPDAISFRDVPSNSPFYDYIETAFANGVLSGYPDGTFRPDAQATRGQICKITYLAATSADDRE